MFAATRKSLRQLVEIATNSKKRAYHVDLDIETYPGLRVSYNIIIMEGDSNSLLHLLFQHLLGLLNHTS